MTLPLAGNRTLFFGKDVDMESIESISQEIVKIDIKNLNPLSKFIKKLSVEVPTLYGLFSIVFAISLGVAAAFIRRFFSNLRKSYFSKATK